MSQVPEKIGNVHVHWYTVLDHRHRRTGMCKHVIGEQPLGEVKGLAICHDPDQVGYYLFYCDEHWNSMTDTWHQTLEDAKDQAEFEYEGSQRTWISQ